MKIPYVFLLFTGISFASDAWFPPEDITSKALSASAQNGPLVLITNFFNPKMTLFDFNRGKALGVDDGRFRQDVSIPIPYEDGFAILGRNVKTIFFMDGSGQFVAQKQLDEVGGWKNEFKVEFVSPLGYHRALLTLSSLGSLDLMLAEFDLVTWQIKILTSRKVEEWFPEQWVAQNKRILLFNKTTGAVVSLDPNTYRIQTTLRAGRDPVKRPHRPRRSPYRARLDLPNILGDTVYFQFYHFTENSRNEMERHPGCLAVSDTGVVLLAERPYGVFGDQWLVYNPQEYLFRLGDQPKPMRGVQ